MLNGAGYRVLQALDGNSAARILDELNGQIDLAIVDLSLPGINGFELIGAVTRRPNSMKVIATSAVLARICNSKTATAVERPCGDP